MNYPKQTLKLSAGQLRALDKWLRHVLAQPTDGNHYTDLLVLTLGKLWEKKVHPKTGLVQRETQMKLDEIQTLALNMSFLVFDLLDADVLEQAQLFQISTALPKLRYDDEQRFLPPTIATNG
jgi:hypothetical protein